MDRMPQPSIMPVKIFGSCTLSRGVLRCFMILIITYLVAIFGQSVVKGARARAVAENCWMTVYSYVADGNVWHYVIYLLDVSNPPSDLRPIIVVDLGCPPQQGLAGESSFVDAVYRFMRRLPFNFNPTEPMVLKREWRPSNRQNTIWRPETFSLMYFPYCRLFMKTDV